MHTRKYSRSKCFDGKMYFLPRRAKLNCLGNIRCFTQKNGLEARNVHTSFMTQEILQYLQPSAGKIYIDMTFGTGGHSTMLLESAPNIKIYALDRDPAAYEMALDLAQKYPKQVVPLLGKFSDLPKLLKEYNVERNSIDGILFHLGCSPLQLEDARRGFSTVKNGPLDMRMDGSRYPEQPTAADVLSKASEIDIYRILKIYGKERQAKKIARNIIEARFLFKNLDTTQELVQLLNSVFSKEIKLVSSTQSNSSVLKVFQALRMFVNNEMNEINYALLLANIYVKITGRLITITLNSLEDTIVKRHLTGNLMDNVANTLPLKYYNYGKTYSADEFEEEKPDWIMLHKRVLLPSDKEKSDNPNYHTAKFRAMKKVK